MARQELVQRAIEAGVTPLEVMIANMTHFHKLALDAEAVLEGLSAADLTGVDLEPADQFKVLLAEVKKAAGLRELAQDCARDAAPFIHARINSIDAGSKGVEAPAEPKAPGGDHLADLGKRFAGGLKVIEGGK